MKETAPILQNGFSLIEILLVVSLLAVVLTIGIISFGNINANSKLDSTTSQIISLLSEARSKSIHSDTDGQLAPNLYGIHFDSDKFVFFRGSSYNSLDPSNFPVVADSVVITPHLPCIPADCNNQIFARVSGEIINFSASLNWICLTNADQTTKLTINYLGVVDVQQNGC